MRFSLQRVLSMTAILLIGNMNAILHEVVD